MEYHGINLEASKHIDNRGWSSEIDDAKAKGYLKAVQDAQAALIRQRVQNGDFEGMPELEELMKQLEPIMNEKQD
jgi:hypothetical protein